MLRQLRIWIAQSAQIDDLVHRAGGCDLGKVARRSGVPLSELNVTAHAVYQVVGGIHTLQGSEAIAGVQHIPHDHLHCAPPWAPGQAFGATTDEDTNPIALFEQTWD